MAKYLPWKQEIAGAKAPDKNRKQYNPTQHQLDCSKASGLFHRIFNWKRENELMEWANRLTEIDPYPETFSDIGETFESIDQLARIKSIFIEWLGNPKEGLLKNTKPIYKSTPIIIRECLIILERERTKQRCRQYVAVEAKLRLISTMAKKLYNDENDSNIDDLILEIASAQEAFQQLGVS